MFLLNRHTHTHTAKAVSCVFIVLPLSPHFCFCLHQPPPLPLLCLILWFALYDTSLPLLTQSTTLILCFSSVFDTSFLSFPLCRSFNLSLDLHTHTHTHSPTRSVSCVFSKNTSVFRQRKVACFLFLDCGIFPQISEPRFFPLCVVLFFSSRVWLLRTAALDQVHVFGLFKVFNLVRVESGQLYLQLRTIEIVSK